MKYLTLSIDFTKDLGKARHLITWFPPFLRRLVANLLTNVEHRINECRLLIEPDILERVDLMDKLGEEWSDKPVSQRKYSVSASNLIM